MGEFLSLEVADGTAMRAYAVRPAGAARGGAVVLQEAFGVNAHIRDLTEWMAGQGYLAVAPELYHRTAPGFEGDYADFRPALPHMNAMTVEGQQQDLRAAHAWLAAQGVERTVAVGFCMGGRVAALAAATVPLAAAASFYGGNLLSLRPQIGAMRAPLLLVWGDQDQHIPPAQRAEFAGLLREHKKPFVECTFSEAGHGFFCDQRPGYHAPSARIAWPLLLTFLAEPAA